MKSLSEEHRNITVPTMSSGQAWWRKAWLCATASIRSGEMCSPTLSVFVTPERPRSP